MTSIQPELKGHSTNFKFIKVHFSHPEIFTFYFLTIKKQGPSWTFLKSKSGLNQD